MARSRAVPVATVSEVEQDIRIRMLNSFLTCPHRDMDSIKPVHEGLRDQDPVFYAHLAAWYDTHGELRDHKEMFKAMLLTDPFTDNREVGLAMFRLSAPYEKRKVLGTIKGRTVKLRHKTGAKVKIRKGRSVDAVRVESKVIGLLKNPPSALKTEVKQYLAWLESDAKRFDEVALRFSGDLKSLYASMRIKPSDRADKILFKGEYPEDSSLNVLGLISKAEKPEDAARLIVQYKIGYTTAVGLIKKITPTILVALINNMSSQELINNIASLEERGATDNPDIKKLIESKLEKAKSAKNVSALKSKVAKNTGRVKSQETMDMLDSVADQQVKKNATIQVPTLLLVDSSSSMQSAIECGKGVASLISGATIADLYVATFSSMAREIAIPKGCTMTQAEKAFAGVNPHGYTSIGAGLELATHKKWLVDQIVIITDEEENSKPSFVGAYRRYEQEMKVSPSIVVIRITGPHGSDETLTRSLKEAGIEFDLYKPMNSDYYAMPGLIPLLSRKSKLDLLFEIMDVPLPVRKPFGTRSKK
jgi:hypothetical protein